MNDSITRPMHTPASKNQHANKSFWAFDSEFLQSGRVNRPEDVQTIQFSNGKDTVVLESPEQLKTWLHHHQNIKTLYAFVLLPDLASIEEWLGNKHVNYKYRGGQLIGQINYRGFHATCYDIRPMLVNFGLFRLEQCGQTVNMPKLQKPDWLGLRHWQNEQEHADFVKYAGNDAVITSLITKWLVSKFNADPAKYASAGTLAKDEFALPKRLKRIKKTVTLSPLELAIKKICYAGRSEAFVTGYVPNVIYNDIKSLYPVSTAATKALQIIGAKQCEKDEVTISNDTNDFGWVEGVFETNNDIWGLPLRGKNNFYATGIIQGLYHSFDLAAAKVKVHHVTRAYKPVFSDDSKTQDKYTDMLLRRLENKMTDNEKMLAKAVLNSLTGKLGQSKPALAVTSNFFAYSTILAFSHAIVSKVFDMCPTPVLGCDTDSAFTQTDISGKKFEVNNMQASNNTSHCSIPVIIDCKGKGDYVMFRSKTYLLKEQDKPITVYGRHGWQYFVEDYLKLFDGTITELQTRQDIKHTLLTRQIEAQKLAKGRWRTKPVTLTLDRLENLLKADTKRNRDNYNSYELVMQRKYETSRAWGFDQIMSLQENKLGYPN